MIHYFPVPYPDELLYSVVARFCLHCSVPYHVASKKLFGRTSIPKVGIPTDIEKFAQVTFPFIKQSPDEIINKMTLFPFFAFFVCKEHAEKAKNAMLSSYIANVLTLLRIPRSKLQYLRYCKQCVISDLDKNGETYWRRLHQLPNVLVCPEHKTVLSQSSATYEIYRRRCYEDATKSIKLDTDVACVDNVEIGKAMLLACHAQEVLNGYDSHISQRKYAVELTDMISKFVNNYWRLYDLKDLYYDLIDFYGERLLHSMQFSFEKFETLSSLKQNYLFNQSGPFPAVYHLLLSNFFHHAAKTGKKYISLGKELQKGIDTRIKSSIGGGPWKCPNPYASHIEEFPIKGIIFLGRYALASCSCGYCFYFNEVSETDPTMPVVYTRVGFGPFWEKKAEQLKSAGLPIYEIGKILNLGCGIVERLLKKQKNWIEKYAFIKAHSEWCRLVSSTAGKTYQEAILINPWLYYSLMKNKTQKFMEETIMLEDKLYRYEYLNNNVMASC